MVSVHFNPNSGERESFETRATDKLRNSGLRMTTPRLMVIRALGATSQAMNPQEIREEVSKLGGRIDLVSVYRILSTLEQVGLVHHVALANGYVACRVDEHGVERTEHMVCDACGGIKELDIPAEALRAIHDQVRSLGFEPVSVRIEIKAKSLPS